MRSRRTKSQYRKAAIEKLRLFTAVASKILRKPMSPAHQDAIALYAARQLPERTVKRLPSRSAQCTALKFIFRTLETPPLPR